MSDIERSGKITGLKSWRAAISAVACLALASASFACGGESNTEVSGPRPELGVNADYDPASSPADLAQESDLVIVGEAGDPHTGRMFGPAPNSPETLTTIVVPIKVNSVEAGTLPPGSDGTVYLEVLASSGQPTESINDGLEGRDGIFYLTKFPDNVPASAELLDADAGRPAGQPLYRATTPQGLLVENNDQSGVWSVGDGSTYPDEGLDDFGVKETEFPEGS